MWRGHWRCYFCFLESCSAKRFADDRWCRTRWTPSRIIPWHHRPDSMAQDIAPGPDDANYKLASSPATAQKEPPPETPNSIKTRGLVILSFWAVVILLGLPVWIWTTSIHRASLPLQDMLDWADGKVLVSFASVQSSR